MEERKSDSTFAVDIRDAPRNIAAREAQERAWGSTAVDVRQQLHAREASRAHSARFRSAVAWFRLTRSLCCLIGEGRAAETNRLGLLSSDLLAVVIGFAFPSQDTLVPVLTRWLLAPLYSPAGAKDGFRVFVRQRPLMPFEIETGEYDVLTVPGHRSIICHDGKIDRSGRRLSMRHAEYCVDHVFTHADSNETVCREALRPLVEHARGGSNSTLILYGQTGTGKTYTLMAALSYIMQFMENERDDERIRTTRMTKKRMGPVGVDASAASAAGADGDAAEDEEEQGLRVELQFIEIHSNKAYDLLQERKPVRLLSDGDERVHARGARRICICLGGTKAPARLADAIAAALRLRSSQVTERNPVSSRSHAVCSVTLRDGSVTGSVTLVDLAGSERNYETVNMTAAMHRESAAINKSLMALKECIRANHHLRQGRQRVTHCIDQPMRRTAVSHRSRRSQRHLTFLSYNFLDRSRAVVSAAVRAPYRASMLTRVLRTAFEDVTHRTAVIATVSPTPTDMQHTINTLDHVCLMATAATDEALNGIRRSVVVDVPLAGASTFLRRGQGSGGGITGAMDSRPIASQPVHAWSADEVLAWLAIAEGGRFSHIVLPPGLTGQGLLELGARRLSALFTAVPGAGHEGRGQGEGESWTVSLDDLDDHAASHADDGEAGVPGGPPGAQEEDRAIAEWRRRRREAIGKDLYNAIRREATARLAEHLGLVA